ncbi:BZ3500_MvSof-1268-A1-R1_Chr10-1g02647 [Microbotryum saponariae]|uniref:BZ3500_MvSof-1268-A1-R1_Chr10-1g02647 protein n=1 Tax=Microbotryum saponariae TaxID=289078 RepID=A0A2X0NJU1_9BASI|nr:BZ3500_MvSof-1268-A1-R1_Chr10-1g02647 [Microbotryum saponariae]SDA06136.1 BZ3501_MvSof-1269-A2-R1_Chr10-1g02248 [Microbotryum saponariae]
MSLTSKRTRRASSRSSDDGEDDAEEQGSSRPQSPVTKASRASDAAPTYTCTLPPTCHDDAQSFSTLATLTAHHEAYHSFVCHARPSSFDFARPKPPHKREYEQQEECSRVFPSQRMLDLHLSECHDELRRAKEDRGEKTFACLHPPCGMHFATPKTRRRHLIDKHGYPKEYFFGVTIWGVQEVLRKGGGMIRRNWTPRLTNSTSHVGKGEAQITRKDDVDEDEEEGTEMAEIERSQSPEERRPANQLKHPTPRVDVGDGMEDLSRQLQGTSITLVPRSVHKAAQKKLAGSSAPMAVER